MTGTITIDDIDIVRDSNGNLVFRDETDTTILTYNVTNDEWVFGADVDASTALIDPSGTRHTGELADLTDLLNVEDDGTVVVSGATAVNAGSNLTVTDDGDGTVTIDAASSTDTRVDVSDDGTQVVAEPTDVNFASNLTVTDDADGTVTVDASGGYSNVASSQITLSSGSGIVDTAISATDATFFVALGIDDPNADAKVASRMFWDDSAGTYKLEIVEDGTSVGNPTVNYDILRVR